MTLIVKSRIDLAKQLYSVLATRIKSTVPNLRRVALTQVSVRPWLTVGSGDRDGLYSVIEKKKIYRANDSKFLIDESGIVWY